MLDASGRFHFVAPPPLLTESLDPRELQLLIAALRYWRTHRLGVTRRTDPSMTPDTIDLLLAKLTSSAVDSLSDTRESAS